MSRSYKKIPYCGDKKGKRKKQIANSKVRTLLKNTNNILLKNNYKKVYDSYNICDYGWITSWEEYWNNKLDYYKQYPNLFDKPDYKKEYRKWYRYYKMK